MSDQLLVEQFLDRPSTADDFALDGPSVSRGRKMDHLATLLVGGSEYDAKSSP
jgi:hypothetical protein